MKKVYIYILIGVMSLGVLGGVTSVVAKTVTKDETTTSQTETDEDNLTNVTTSYTLEQANQIVLDANPNATIVSSNLEDENGVYVYGVIITKDSTQYEVKVDANTGVILSTEVDNDKDSETSSNETDNDQVDHENQNEDGTDVED